MNLPSFLCIGAQKAATSWLYYTLLEHPDVWMPPIKELHYFDHLYVPENRKWSQKNLKTGAANAIRQHLTDTDDIRLDYVKYLCDLALVNVFTESWYQEAYNRPEAQYKALGEVSPEYCTIPVEGIEYIKSFLGNIKIIYIIRDPFERAKSQIKMAVHRQLGDDPSEANISRLEKIAANLPILNRGDYRTYIPNWVDVFGKENLLFIPFTLIQKDPDQVMRDIESHLDISHYSNYTCLNSRHHESIKIEIPDSVIAPLADELQSQRNFLNDYFPTEFTSLI